MRIAMIGAGNVGRALGEAWRGAGHDVVYGVRRPADEPDAADIAGAIAAAEVVLLAVPAGERADLVWCGPDEVAERVETLIADVGLRPIRAGDHDKIEAVDGLAVLWFALALGQGRGRHLAFHVLGD